MSVTDARLRMLVQDAARSSDDLFRLLVEGLSWPVPDGLTLEDVELDWDPAELHLDPDKVPTLRGISQIPPLTSDQNFGVFILEFENGRLPVGAIRRIVDRLVQRKRARSGSGLHPVWSLEDLLFFCFTEGAAHALHVVAFQENEGKRVLRVVSWAPDMTDTRADLLLKRGIPDLVWATGRPAITLDSEAFHGYRESIRSAAALSARMAEVAQDVRDEVSSLYEIETDDGPIRRLFRDVQEQLLGDLTPARFADVYAQTMVYGLLTARIAHPEQFAADRTITAVSFDNPFLDAIYARFRAQSSDVVDVDELGLRELAEQLAATDVDELLADFGAKQRKDDPVVFFYEDFLARYDPQQRRDLGAFYTPLPVVRYMVRTVDEVLKRDFGLPLGVADATTWGELVERDGGRSVPTGVDPDEPVARMVDPANGTGTFFVEWLRQVAENGGPECLEAALGRIDALEISLASYAVAHLKVSIGLPSTIRERARLPIYLGDTLAGPRPHVFDEMADPVSTEGSLADEAKFERRHNVVIGNPPYDRVESTGTGGFIADRRDGARSLFDDILDPARQHTIFSHQASLYNLYVYFWRWTLWKAFEQQDGPAVVSMITAASWLTGPGFLGLRQLVRELADELYVVDLGGENKGARKEENVFDIETPVAIVTVIRRGSTDEIRPAQVSYRRIHGTRAEKLSQLDRLSTSGHDDGWIEGPTGWHDPLVPPTGDADWASYAALIDLLPWQQPGVMINRTWPVAPDVATLDARWRRFMSTTDSADRSTCFVTPKTGRTIFTSVRGLTRLADLPVGAQHEAAVRYGMRSFDRQWIFDDPRLMALERPSLWDSLSDRQVFMTTMTTGKLGQGPAATVTTAVPDKHHFRGSFGGKDVIPLYRDAAGTPNADPELLRRLTEAHTGGGGTAVTVERLFAYIYGLLAGADYTERFTVALETPGPRVPLSADPVLFDQVVKHGEDLLLLHTFGERDPGGAGRGPILPDHRIAWSAPVGGLPIDLTQVRYDQDTCELHVADGTLTGVRPDVWLFEVSGMQVVRKWLGYRTAKGAGRAASSTSPLDHIRPTSWLPEWSEELRDLVDVLTKTLDLLPLGADLLERVCAGPLIPARSLPQPPAELRQPPKSSSGDDQQDALFSD